MLEADYFSLIYAEAQNDCVFVILSLAKKPASAFQKNKSAFPWKRRNAPSTCNRG
jgi:hypothetical protein